MYLELTRDSAAPGKPHFQLENHCRAESEGKQRQEERVPVRAAGQRTPSELGTASPTYQEGLRVQRRAHLLVTLLPVLWGDRFQIPKLVVTAHVC